MVEMKTVGRTFWDVLYVILSRGGPWIIALLAFIIIGYIITHPNIANEWNVFLSTKAAQFLPQKRKKTFERRVDLTLQRVRNNIKKSSPEYVEKFIPYSLKVQWIEPDKENSFEGTIDSLIENRQIILYVPSYKEEEKQTVNILYNYCMKGFATKPKCYMKDADKKAADLVMTGKLAQNAGHHVYDYYNRVYVREMLEKDSSFKASYNELKAIDTDGLFLPLFINEIDKYATRIYSSGVSLHSISVVEHLKEFLLRIIKKGHDEHVELNFNEDGISIHIELAVGDCNTQRQIENIVSQLEAIVTKKKVNTIYILASGSKMDSANTIATDLEERVVQDIYEPQITQYKRYTRQAEGKDSICFEINVR